MALSAWQRSIVNENGDVIPSATVQVIDDATGLNATIFSDSSGTSLSNPFTTTVNGFAQFYANAGTYRIVASDSGTGFSETWQDQRLGDAQARDVGTASNQLPTSGVLSTAVTGTAAFSSDTYTFSPSGTGFRTLEAGMYISFRLPSGSANTTTTPDIGYDGTTYTIKWINGSALEADDLNETYNKQPILFYFDGTDMLLASDIRGATWEKKANGVLEMGFTDSYTGNGSDLQSTQSVSFPKNLSTTSNFTASVNTSDTTGAGGVHQRDEYVEPFSVSTFRYRVRMSGSTSDTLTTTCYIRGRWY